MRRYVVGLTVLGLAALAAPPAEAAHQKAVVLATIPAPSRLSGTPGAVDRAAPLLGQNTEELLVELGYTEAERRDLEARRIVQRWPNHGGKAQ